VALRPIAAQAQKYGVLAKDSLELPFVGIFMAPLFLLLDFGERAHAINQLLITCIVLLLVSGILGLATGVAIRISDPYGVVSLTYVFTSSSVVAALSCVAVVLIYPRFATSYVILAVPALALVAFTFGPTMRAIAYPKSVRSQVDN